MRTNSRGTRSFRAALAILFAVAATGPLFAVTDEEIFRDFRFNLTNPGARSLGLGGAFIAVSDDATAALSNPAGLMLLARPEFFTEVRATNIDDTAIEQTIPNSGIDINASTSPSGVFSPSFISYVYPWKRFAAGFSRTELNKSMNRTSNSFFIDFDGNPGTTGDTYQFLGAGAIETDLAVYNFSGAVKILDRLSFGATLTVGTVNMKSGVQNYFVDGLGILADPNIVQNPIYLIYNTAIDDTDTDVAFNAGIHWGITDKISVGAVYREGMEFELEEGIFNEQVMTALFGQNLSTALGTSILETTLNTPTSYGAGVSWRPMGPLTISADWVHIQYEDLLDGFQSGINVLTLFDTSAVFTIEDADEFHLGVEYVFTAGSVPLAVRGGAYSDHNSRIYADFDNGFSFFSTSDTFPERDSETHYTLGAGVVVKERFQIDAAADMSGIGNEFVLSTIFRF